jgi:hypothetical protein
VAATSLIATTLGWEQTRTTLVLADIRAARLLFRWRPVALDIAATMIVLCGVLIGGWSWLGI